MESFLLSLKVFCFDVCELAYVESYQVLHIPQHYFHLYVEWNILLSVIFFELFNDIVPLCSEFQFLLKYNYRPVIIYLDAMPILFSENFEDVFCFCLLFSVPMVSLTHSLFVHVRDLFCFVLFNQSYSVVPGLREPVLDFFFLIISFEKWLWQCPQILYLPILIL